jgi:hypothetical protein
METNKKKQPRNETDPCAESPLPGDLPHQDFLAIRNNLYVWLTASIAHLDCVLQSETDQDAVDKITQLTSNEAHCVIPVAGDLLYFVQAIRGSLLSGKARIAQQAAFRMVAQTLQGTPSLTTPQPRDGNGGDNPWSQGSTHPELGELDAVFIANE